MAAYLNRGTSMIGGDGSQNRLGLFSNGATRSHAASSDSPLQVFVRAKKKINDIFVEIHDFTKDTAIFLKGISFILLNITYKFNVLYQYL